MRQEKRTKLMIYRDVCKVRYIHITQLPRTYHRRDDRARHRQGMQAAQRETRSGDPPHALHTSTPGYFTSSFRRFWIQSDRTPASISPPTCCGTSRNPCSSRSDYPSPFDSRTLAATLVKVELCSRREISWLGRSCEG